MADQADVRSLEQMDAFREQTLHFRAHLLQELETLELELRRMTLWLTSDAHAYWSDELTKSQRQLAEAQAAMTRCMSYVRADEQRPCTEEKKRFRKAKERRALCEHMMRTLRSAIQRWEREQASNIGKIQHCRDMAETELMVAAAYLNDQIEALQRYAGLRSPKRPTITEKGDLA